MQTLCLQWPNTILIHSNLFNLPRFGQKENVKGDRLYLNTKLIVYVIVKSHTHPMRAYVTIMEKRG